MYCLQALHARLSCSFLGTAAVCVSPSCLQQTCHFWGPTDRHCMQYLLQVGERVSIVCSPTERSAQSMLQGRFRPFGSGPPFTKPGQPLSATNHDTGREHALQPPPSIAAGIPGWVLPAAVLFSASDAASGTSLTSKACPQV